MAHRTRHSGDPKTVHLAVNLNDSFAMPLAAMARSAVDALREGWKIELYVLDGGISLRNRCRLERSWEDAPLEVHWLKPDLACLEGLPIDHQWGPATYFRLLISDVLPPQVERALYLDCDLIVRRDLVHLWEEPFDGALCLAAQDPTSSCFDPASVPAPKRVLPLGASVPNWRELGLSGTLPYFNAGVLAVDLAAWRREGLAQRLLDCLRENKAHAVYADQYALNVVCAGRWRMLDPRWNRPARLVSAPDDSWDDPLYTRDGWARLLADPWIIHYIGRDKPWHVGGPPAERKEFYAALDRTDWAGWRPRRTWGEWWERRTKAFARIQSRLLPARSRAA